MLANIRSDRMIIPVFNLIPQIAHIAHIVNIANIAILRNWQCWQCRQCWQSSLHASQLYFYRKWVSI